MQHETNLKLKEIALLRQKRDLKQGLPHIYGFPWYPWAKKFVDSTNRINFLCAGNQLSKSSTQIRKCIDWAVNKEKWPTLWATRPLQFWYLYPTKEVATIEYHKKWVEEFLPAGKYKDDPYYGWKVEMDGKYIQAIHFFSKVSVYFKTYAQQVKNLQSGTCHAIFCDEELPFEIFAELKARLLGSRGHFHMVFTATLGQQEWKDTIEPVSKKREKFPAAFKLQVSVWDCQYYIDGSASQWTDERIAEETALIGDKREIQRRLFGKFVLASGLRYPAFDRDRNWVEPPKDQLVPPKDWPRYLAVDIGSGLNPDKKNNSHPGAVAMIAVRPDMKYGRIYKAWRGDNERTTAGDCFNKALDMRGDEQMTRMWYDWQCKDFAIIAERNGEPFEPAEKGHDRGEEALNTLFKYQMLVIDDNGDPELEKMVNEFCNLKKDEAKQSAKDDLIDTARYVVVLIPWNWEAMRTEVKEEAKKKKPPPSVTQQRLDFYNGTSQSGFDTDIMTVWEDEIQEYNEYMEIH